jgi:type IV pilus assembly protein PilF
MLTYRPVVFIFILTIYHLAACTGPSQYQKQKEAQALKEIGEAYFAQGNYSAALAEFLRAERLAPNDPLLQNDLGICYMAKNRLDLSVQHFKKAIQQKPDYASARNNLGTAYLSQKDWDAAIATFKEITEDLLYATPHYPLSNLGLAYFNKGNYRMAEDFYKQALKIEPDFFIALRGLGRTYKALRKTNEAIATFEKAAAISPTSPVIYVDLAEAYELAGDYQNAKTAYERVLQIEPQGPQADQATKGLARLRP